MDVSVMTQVFIFGTLFVCGAGLGFLFDLFRIFRKVNKSSDTATFFQDLLFWIAAIAIVFWHNYTFNNSELRWFEFAGVLVAGLIYNLTLSKIVVKVGVKIYYAIKKLIIGIIKIVLTPVAFIYKLVRKPFIVVFNATGRGAKRCNRFRRGIFMEIRRSFSNFFKIFKKI